MRLGPLLAWPLLACVRGNCVTPYSCKSCDPGVVQMALVLGLESVDELSDYWGGDSAITWRLSAAEVRSTLSQRADFSKDTVMALNIS